MLFAILNQPNPVVLAATIKLKIQQDFLEVFWLTKGWGDSWPFNPFDSQVERVSIPFLELG